MKNFWINSNCLYYYNKFDKNNRIMLCWWKNLYQENSKKGKKYISSPNWFNVSYLLCLVFWTVMSYCCYFILEEYIEILFDNANRLRKVENNEQDYTDPVIIKKKFLKLFNDKWETRADKVHTCLKSSLCSVWFHYYDQGSICAFKYNVSIKVQDNPETSQFASPLLDIGEG